MTRSDSHDELLGEASLEALDPVERLLRNANEAAHEAVAGVLWEAESDEAAVQALVRLQAESGEKWEGEVRAGDRGGGAGGREEKDDRG